MILHPPHTYINMYIHKNTDRHDLHKKILSYSFFIDKLVNHILFDACISSTYSILLRYWLLDDGRTVCVCVYSPHFACYKLSSSYLFFYTESERRQDITSVNIRPRDHHRFLLFFYIHLNQFRALV